MLAGGKNVYSDDKLFAEWLDKSINYVSALPPKKKRKKQNSIKQEPKANQAALGYEPKILTNMAYFSSAFKASRHCGSDRCPSKSR
jgi:hypothetical protein